MRIGVDARPLASTLAGIGHYLVELLSAMAPLSRHDFVLYAHRPVGFALPNARWRAELIRSPGSAWLQLYGARLARQDGIDLFWGAHFLLPPRLPPRIRTVLTVYDLVPFLHPRTMRFSAYVLYRTLLKPSLMRADHITVISHSVAADLQRMFSLPPERMTVIPPGVAPHVRPHGREAATEHVARAFGIDRPYLLAVGTLEPRKNLLTLLRALTELPVAVRRRMTVLIAGTRGWKNSALDAAAAPLLREGTLHLLGYVPDAELPWLYSGALALVYPSLYEGFGIPVIEAMACGTPVIVSDIPVLREVAEQAAIFAPPLDVGQWSLAIGRILDDPAMRTELVERGKARATQFSYDVSARRMLDVFGQLVR